MDERRVSLFMSSHILQIRSPSTIQPIVGNDYVLSYNGEIYSDTMQKNDLQFLYDQILENFHGNSESLINILRKLDGEYSFILFDKQNCCLWFGRDPVGRRSLVINHDITTLAESGECSNQIIISSVSDPLISSDWSEIPAGYIYRLSLFSDHLSILNEGKNPCIKLERFNFPMNLFNAFDFSTLNDVDIRKMFSDHLHSSISSRVSFSSRNFSSSPSDSENGIPEISVLFSGGIDCTVLCAIASKFFPEGAKIDLLNLAFFNDIFDSLTSRDRISSRFSHEFLSKKFPLFNWVLVEIDVSEEELIRCREERIKYLIHPLNTVIDDSLGCSLWFASRGLGKAFVIKNDKRELVDENYISSSKILLSGLGADELLCGYSRYYKELKNGVDSAINAMRIDIERIGSRNLGRDDRCCSDHGCEVRFPYLEEKFINFCTNLPFHYKCDPLLPTGVGDKKILRELALELGLCEQICYKKKVALQFGCQFVKVSKKEGTGNSISSKLLIK